MANNRNDNILLEKLETYCKEKGMRYTASRQIALSVIASSPRPIGAYDIIEEMGKITNKPKPTTVYRAIDFLQKHCFIHKIESLNAFTVCAAEHRHDGVQFIMCTCCGAVEEVHACHLPEALQNKIEACGFKMKQWNTEVHGICRRCQ